MSASKVRKPRTCKFCPEVLHATASELWSHSRGHNIPLLSIKSLFDLKVWDYVEGPGGLMKVGETDERILRVQRISEDQFLVLTENNAFVMSDAKEQEAKSCDKSTTV